MPDHQETISHIVNTGKVTSGGLGLWATTYAAVSNMTIENATQIASLTAAVMTTIYFAVSAAYAAWKWYKEAKNASPK